MVFDGAVLYQLRLKKNMSRADLAVAIRTASGGRIKASERGIRGWEKNEYAPSGEAMPAIADALDCAISDLYAELADDDEEADALSGLTRAEADLLDRLSFEQVVAYKAQRAAARSRVAAEELARL